MVSLTGDVATGKEVARAAADSLKRVHLELGGKAPVIVFDDADLDAVAEGIAPTATTTRARTARPPRACWSARASTTTCSPASCPSVQQINTRRPGHDDDARDGPARLGGPARPRLRLPRARHEPRARGRHRRRRRRPAAASSSSRRSWPDVTQDFEIVQREVFGPVVSVERFHDEAEALPGPTASTTASRPRSGRATSAARCAWARLQFGFVWINTHGPGSREMPHGGFKESGYGKDMSDVRRSRSTRRSSTSWPRSGGRHAQRPAPRHGGRDHGSPRAASDSGRARATSCTASSASRASWPRSASWRAPRSWPSA